MWFNLHHAQLRTIYSNTSPSPMSGIPTVDIDKWEKKQKRGEFTTPPCPTGRRSSDRPLEFRQNHVNTTWTAPKSRGVHVDSTKMTRCSRGQHQNHAVFTWTAPQSRGVHVNTTWMSPIPRASPTRRPRGACVPPDHPEGHPEGIP